jgi:signal transduction histidine kinase
LGTLFPLRDASGAIGHVALCVKDVTAQLELQETAEALRHSEEQLRQSQKLEAVGRLAGGIAHDFNNLLSVILSYSELLLRGSRPGHSIRVELEEIKKAGQRAADLTRQLLAFSRQQVLDLKVLDLNELVTGISTMLTRVLGEDIELKTEAAPGLGKVRADPGQIEQVIMNLAVNARDAMPTGGRLTIETADVLVDEGHAREHPGVSPGEHVMIAVSDTGSGMDESTRSRVFEPFFTTKERGKGTGLGLSTVFGIVRQSGGHIGLHSELGRGTRFTIYLPRVEDSVETISSIPPAVEARGTETILLVEDEEQVRNVTAGILRSAGYCLLEAARPKEAIALCEGHPAEIHMLLTDVVMPEMNGRQLATRVTLLRPAIKVLFMSGYTDDAILRHGILDSGVAFLQKPLTPTGLTRKVREVLDSR